MIDNNRWLLCIPMQLKSWPATGTNSMKVYLIWTLLLVLAPLAYLGGQEKSKGAADRLSRREWTVEEASREALVSIPATATTSPTPVVFAFHGHGGTMRNSARSFGYHRIWPEAIVVYMQGLNTPGRLTDPEGKLPGWQSAAGDQGDRDLKFFDAVLASLKHDYHVDERRIYATGHSNGGGFTYLLWAARGDVFAAMAPSSAAATRTIGDLKPKPVLHVAGEADPLVKYEWQKATVAAIRKLNGCDEQGTAWEKWCTVYPSSTGTPVVTYIHPGNHTFSQEAPPTIVKFFKQHAKP
jgi:polyhydroxybutyrate depolymerase